MPSLWWVEYLAREWIVGGTAVHRNITTGGVGLISTCCHLCIYIKAQNTAQQAVDILCVAIGIAGKSTIPQ